MKKLLSLILALLMCVSLFAACDTFDYEDDDEDDEDAPNFSLNQKEDDEEEEDDKTPVEAPEPVDAAALYTNFLVNGGYESLTKDSSMAGEWSSDWKVATCRVDLNEDNIPELLVVLTNEEFMGVRGYPTLSALLAIQNGEVTVLTKTEYTGGSMGGDFLYLVQDEQQGKLRVGKFGYWRVNGNEAYFNSTLIYDYNGATLLNHFSAEDGYYYIPRDPNAVKEIQANTDLYTINGDEFYYWKADGRYVTQEDHDAAKSCYVILHDATAPGTHADPLNLGNS